MNPNDIHFYSNKLKALLLLIISSTFIFCGFIFWDILLDFSNHPFQSLMIILGMSLFVFGIVMAVILLLRVKPLLSVNDKQIIIYDIFRKPTALNLNEIKSFELFEIRTLYSTNREILIELKNPSTKIRSSLYYKLMNQFSQKIANTKYSIRPQFIKANHNDLVKILNQKLKNVA